MALSISRAEATPSSTMRMASRAMATPKREEAKPGASLTTTAVFPKSSTQPFAVSTKASGVDLATTTSTNFDAGTGLKKCRPMTSFATVSANSATESEEVLVAITACGAACAILLNAVVFKFMDSVTASTTNSKPAKSLKSLLNDKRTAQDSKVTSDSRYL